MRRTRPDETVLCVHPHLHMQLARAIIAERLRDAPGEGYPRAASKRDRATMSAQT
jgi:hypothetical protein